MSVIAIYRERVKISHVIVEFRVINHHPKYVHFGVFKRNGQTCCPPLLKMSSFCLNHGLIEIHSVIAAPRPNLSLPVTVDNIILKIEPH